MPKRIISAKSLTASRDFDPTIVALRYGTIIACFWAFVKSDIYPYEKATFCFGFSVLRCTFSNPAKRRKAYPQPYDSQNKRTMVSSAGLYWSAHDDSIPGRTALQGKISLFSDSYPRLSENPWCAKIHTYGVLTKRFFKVVPVNGFIYVRTYTCSRMQSLLCNRCVFLLFECSSQKSKICVAKSIDFSSNGRFIVSTSLYRVMMAHFQPKTMFFDPRTKGAGEKPPSLFFPVSATNAKRHPIGCLCVVKGL